MSTLLGLCGSLRRASLNRKLMHAAFDRWDGPCAEGDLRLPLYDGDLEADGMPSEVQRLSDAIRDAAAVVVVTPEYNKGPSGVLKNALDWVSRTKGSPWRGKPVAVMSATAGRAGGERAQYALRLMLLPFRPDVLPGPEVLVGQAAQQFDEEGRLVNERNAAALDELMAALAERAR